MSAATSIAKFMDPPSDNGLRSARYNSGLLRQTGIGGGATRARSAPRAITAQGIGYDTMDIATRVATDGGGAIDCMSTLLFSSLSYRWDGWFIIIDSLQRRARFQHGGHVFK
jgi:hypothetical protein